MAVGVVGTLKRLVLLLLLLLAVVLVVVVVVEAEAEAEVVDRLRGGVKTVRDEEGLFSLSISTSISVD